MAVKVVFEMSTNNKNVKPRKGTWIVKLVNLTKCETCNVFLLNSKQLMEHKQEHARTKETKEINKKYRFICEFCKETFLSVILLRDHIHSLHMKTFYEDTENSITNQITEPKKKSEESIVL